MATKKGNTSKRTAVKTKIPASERKTKSRGPSKMRISELVAHPELITPEVARYIAPFAPGVKAWASKDPAQADKDNRSSLLLSKASALTDIVATVELEGYSDSLCKHSLGSALLHIQELIEAAKEIVDGTGRKAAAAGVSHA